MRDEVTRPMVKISFIHQYESDETQKQSIKAVIIGWYKKEIGGS